MNLVLKLRFNLKSSHFENTPLLYAGMSLVQSQFSCTTVTWSSRNLWAVVLLQVLHQIKPSLPGLQPLLKGCFLIRKCCQGRTLAHLLKLNGNMGSSKGKLKRPKYQGFLLLVKALLCFLYLWGNLFSQMSQEMSARFYTQRIYFR